MRKNNTSVFVFACAIDNKTNKRVQVIIHNRKKYFSFWRNEKRNGWKYALQLLFTKKRLFGFKKRFFVLRENPEVCLLASTYYFKKLIQILLVFSE